MRRARTDGRIGVLSQILPWPARQTNWLLWFVWFISICLVLVEPDNQIDQINQTNR